tara:strand:- start:314 stop:520 length:207 start_codon:yes stop_codon:yes gene_type:complete
VSFSFCFACIVCAAHFAGIVRPEVTIRCLFEDVMEFDVIGEKTLFLAMHRKRLGILVRLGAPGAFTGL